jgi:hypothetical protein
MTGPDPNSCVRLTTLLVITAVLVGWACSRSSSGARHEWKKTSYKRQDVRCSSSELAEVVVKMTIAEHTPLSAVQPAENGNASARRRPAHGR